MERPMRDSTKGAEVPRSVRELVLGYLNTCQVMSKLWLYAMGFLALALPLGFYGAGNSHVEALINGGGFWLITGILSRLAVFEFRQLRAGWVARRIGRRVRTGTPGWEALVRWIAEENDGNYLNTVLKKLGVSPRSTGIFATPLQESLAGTAPQVAEMAGDFFERLVPGAGPDSTTETCVYTTTKTQMLNDDGEWVTVDSETTSHGDLPVDEAMRRAMAMLEEASAKLPDGMIAADAPARRGSIPLSSEEGSRPRPVRVDSRERRRPDYMPLELDEFDPDDEEDEETEERPVGVSKSRRKD